MNGNFKEITGLFVSWIKVKIRRHLLQNRVLFNEGEIWWVALGHNVGVEANGKNHQFERPVLVVKKFNKDSFWGISVSSVQKEGFYYYSLTLGGVYYGFNLSQLRILSDKRLLRRMTKVPHIDLVKMRQRLADLLV